MSNKRSFAFQVTQSARAVTKKRNIIAKSERTHAIETERDNIWSSKPYERMKILC
jgi:hypothetical protein